MCSGEGSARRGSCKARVLQGEGSAKTSLIIAPTEEEASAQPVKPVLPNVGVPEVSLIYLLPENLLWVELPLDVLI